MPEMAMASGADGGNPAVSGAGCGLHILLIYARHLVLTLDNRAIALGFATIAQSFGTARPSKVPRRWSASSSASAS